MNTATATVTDGKLAPMQKQGDALIVGQNITAQALIDDFNTFKTAELEGQKKACAAIIHAALIGRNASHSEFGLATSGMVESTRTKDADGKAVDGPDTKMARKFQSYVRNVWGAIKHQRMSPEKVEGYTNSQKLYEDASLALDGKVRIADKLEIVPEWPGIRWDGELLEVIEKRNAARKNTKAVTQAAEEMGLQGTTMADLLSLSPEQVSALKANAEKLRRDEEQKKRLDKINKRIEKLAKDLYSEYGADDAEHILKAALEKVAELATSSQAGALL